MIVPGPEVLALKQFGSVALLLQRELAWFGLHMVVVDCARVRYGCSVMNYYDDWVSEEF